MTTLNLDTLQNLCADPSLETISMEKAELAHLLQALQSAQELAEFYASDGKYTGETARIWLQQWSGK